MIISGVLILLNCKKIILFTFVILSFVVDLIIFFDYFK